MNQICMALPISRTMTTVYNICIIRAMLSLELPNLFYPSHIFFPLLFPNNLWIQSDISTVAHRGAIFRLSYLLN
uniref:Uncharacterized protein n=1 Tax=Anguilla anguilla TaxID=7936 RepID=A0A0E9RF08_ANGAN